MHFELSPLIVWTGNTCSEFQVNIFSKNRYYKISRFLHNNNTDAKAIAIPWVFSENTRAKNVGICIPQHKGYK